MKILITENQLEKVIYNYITRYVGKLKNNSKADLRYPRWINQYKVNMFLFDTKHGTLFFREEIQFSLVKMFNLHPQNANGYIIRWAQDHLKIKSHIRSSHATQHL